MFSVLPCQIVLMKTRREEKTLPKGDQLEWIAGAIDEHKAVKSGLKTINLNQYYLTALGLNSITFYNLENGMRDFIWWSIYLNLLVVKF